MERDPFDAAHAKRGEAVVVLQVTKGTLDRRAASVKSLESFRVPAKTTKNRVRAYYLNVAPHRIAGRLVKRVGRVVKSVGRLATRAVRFVKPS